MPQDDAHEIEIELTPPRTDTMGTDTTLCDTADSGASLESTTSGMSKMTLGTGRYVLPATPHGWTDLIIDGDSDEEDTKALSEKAEKAERKRVRDNLKSLLREGPESRNPPLSPLLSPTPSRPSSRLGFFGSRRGSRVNVLDNLREIPTKSDDFDISWAALAEPPVLRSDEQVAAHYQTICSAYRQSLSALRTEELAIKNSTFGKVSKDHSKRYQDVLDNFSSTFDITWWPRPTSPILERVRKRARSRNRTEITLPEAALQLLTEFRTSYHEMSETTQALKREMLTSFMPAEGTQATGDENKKKKGPDLDTEFWNQPLKGIRIGEEDGQDSSTAQQNDSSTAQQSDAAEVDLVCDVHHSGTEFSEEL